MNTVAQPGRPGPGAAHNTPQNNPPASHRKPPAAGAATHGPTRRTRDAATTLTRQARDIIDTALTNENPHSLRARNRLRHLLAVHPDDPVAVLREYLSLTRGLTRTRPGPPDNARGHEGQR